MVLVERKVPNGKLVRVDAEFEGGCIAHIRITGDFFMHPEDALPGIEGKICGIGISEARHRIPEIFDAASAEIIGFSPHDIYEMVIEAYSQVKGREG